MPSFEWSNIDSMSAEETRSTMVSGWVELSACSVGRRPQFYSLRARCNTTQHGTTRIHETQMSEGVVGGGGVKIGLCEEMIRETNTQKLRTEMN